MNSDLHPRAVSEHGTFDYRNETNRKIKDYVDNIICDACCSFAVVDKQ